MTRAQAFLLTLVFAAAVTARMVSLPTTPFFCDVPANMTAVLTGTMHIQFPGYVPFHLLVTPFAYLFGSVPAGIVYFSLICSIGAMVYCLLFANDRVGFPGALLATTVIGLSPVTVYFACMGASYTTDLLSMSALIFHGNRFLATNDDRQYRWVVVWFIFGSLMRSLSFPFAGLAVLYLLGRRPTRANILFTAAVFAFGIAFYTITAFYYFKSWQNILGSMGPAAGTLKAPFTFYWFLGNETRNILFISWSLNVYLFLVLAVLWLGRRNHHVPLRTYFLYLIVPYSCFLFWYDCHAGYICMLIPAFVCAPWIVENPRGLNARAIPVAAVFGILALLQFFVARPIPFTGKISLTLNSYVLTYTRGGIALGMFDNLKGWERQYHLDHQGVPWF